MPSSVKCELDNLIKEINDALEVNSIYLFGSYAYGEPNEDSDLDLCLVTNDKSMRKLTIMKQARKAIAKIQSMPVDLLIYYSDEFMERASVETSLESEIFQRGVKLYGQ